MAELFFSHVEEDFDVVEELATGLEEAGYSTWFYERNSVVGPPHLLQTRRAIDAARAVVLVVSAKSLEAHQVNKEVHRAADAGKDFIPVLLDVPYAAFSERRPEWEEAIGGAVAGVVKRGDVAVVLPRLIDGLKALGIHPEAAADPLDERLAGIAAIARSPERAGEADDALRALLRDFPNSARVHHALGQLSNRRFQHDAAVAAFERAIELEPDNAAFQLDLGVTYQTMGRGLEAVERLQRAVELGLDPARERHARALLKASSQGAA